MSMNGNSQGEDKVERVRPEDMPREEKQASGGLKALLMPGVLSLAITLAVVNFWVMPQFDKFSAIMQGINTEVAAAKAAVTPLSTQLTTLTSQVSQISNSINAVNQEIAAIKSREANFLTADKITAMQTQITQFSTTITGYSTQITKMQTQVDALTAKVISLEATHNGTSTSNGTGMTTGQVTATVLGNYFTGGQYLSFPETANGTSSTQLLSFEINNGTGKTINNLQLAFLLQSDVLWPTDVVVTVLSGAGLMGTTWTQQYSDSYYKGFTNGATTGIWGTIGTVSQGTGKQTYNVSISVKNNNPTNPLPKMIVYPVVKVIGYN